MANDLSRREVLWMTAIAAAAMTPVGKALAAGREVIDAGALTKYEEQGIYPQFQPTGFFVIRRGDRIVAQSSLCTHKRCKLKPSAEGFACGCHGSRFSVDGKVTKAPAKKDLPRYGVELSKTGHIMVDMSREFDPDEFGKDGAYLEVPAQ